MRVCIHRGSTQIGGSCVEVEDEGKRLLIDLGLPLDADADGEKYLPAVAGLNDNDKSLLGILISHLHLDHYGLLEYVSTQIPIGMGAAAKRILKAAAPFMPHNKNLSLDGWDFDSGQSFKIDPFTVTPYLVDHSAYDSYALHIESNGKSIFYSGDFRVHGRKASVVEKLISNPPANIDALILEGSSFGRISKYQQFPTEADVENRFVKVLAQTKGLGLVHLSAQNIDRIVSVFRAAKRTGRKLIIDLYPAAILEATGNNHIPQSSWDEIALLIPQPQRVQIKENEWFDLLNAHSKNRIFPEQLCAEPEKYVLLFRPLHCRDLEEPECLDGAVYVYSMWEGYWNNGSFDNIKKWLAREKIEKISIHTSGHASLEDLKKLISAINPVEVVPIHTFYPENYNQISDKVKRYPDGQWWEV